MINTVSNVSYGERIKTTLYRAGIIPSRIKTRIDKNAAEMRLLQLALKTDPVKPDDTDYGIVLNEDTITIRGINVYI